MIIKSAVFFIIISICFSFSASGQQLYSGVLKDTVLHSQVPRAHIHNSSTNTMVLADSRGIFSIYAHIGDTILVSSIGYYWYKHVVESFDECTLYIQPQVYEIEKVYKYAEVPFHELTEIILAMPLVEDSIRLHLPFEKFFPMREYQPGQLTYSVDGLITAIYNSVNRHARNKLRAMELIKNAHTIVVVNQKFSYALVKELTNLPDEYIEDFVVFLNLSDEFLYQTSQYVIIAYMYARLEEFLLKNPHIQQVE